MENYLHLIRHISAIALLLMVSGPITAGQQPDSASVTLQTLEVSSAKAPKEVVSVAPTHTIANRDLDKMGINGEYDLLISNITTAATGDPQSFLKGYWYSNPDGGNPQNGSGYSNPQYDALWDQLEGEFDPAKRRDLIIQLQQIIMDDSATIIYGYPITNLISSTKIKGAIMHPSDYYWLTDTIAPAK